MRKSVVRCRTRKSQGNEKELKSEEKGTAENVEQYKVVFDEDLKFEDLFNLKDIQSIQDAFALATGVASIITDSEGRPITRASNFCNLCQNIIRKTKKGLENCYHSDAVLGRQNPQGPLMQPCLSGGLWDGGASISVGNRHIANWLIGQVLDDSIQQDTLLAYADEIGADREEFRRALGEVTRMPKEQFANVCRALFLIAGQLSRLALQNVQQIRYIAQRKRMHEEIHALNITLEQRVYDRTVQLESAVKELEAFSYSVSHDLRAPLRAIDGFSRILQEDYQASLDPTALHFLNLVRLNTQKMGQLVDDLLAFARMGRQTLNKQPLSLDTMIRQILDELLPQEGDRQIEIRFDNLPWVEADPALIKQVFVNLIANALKFTRTREQAQILIGFIPESGVEIPESEGRSSQIKGIYFIKDNGVGFDMRYVNKLFTVFQRLHRTDEFEGTGVGLAIVDRIIRRHGGRIWAEAELDRGASFYFTLPGVTLL